MNIDEMIRRIAIEEAPRDIVKRWKIELRMRQMTPKRNWNWIYVVFPVLFAMLFFMVYFFNIKILWNIETLNFSKIFKTIYFILSSYESFVASPYFLIGSIVFFVIIASLSLSWYYIKNTIKI